MRRTRILADGFCEIAGCERLPLPGTRRCRAHPVAAAVPSTEPDLFTPRDLHPKYRAAAPDSFRDHPPSARGSATSKAAAERMGTSGRARTLGDRVADALRDAGAAGLTRAELSRQLPARLSSVCAVVDTLKKLGVIGHNPGHTRRDPETQMNVEVLVAEAYVTRWEGTRR